MKNPTQLKSPASVVTDAPASRAASRRSSLPGFAFLRACAAGIALAALPVQAQISPPPLTAEVEVEGAVNPFPNPSIRSSWNVGGSLGVGNSGWGRMTISGGGYVTSTSGSLGLGGLGAPLGEVTVTGANSTWTNSGTLIVGNYGTGKLTIAAGGAVFNTNGFVGYGFFHTGEVTVTGANSRWVNSGQLAIGDDIGSKGTLTLANGGLVSVGNGAGTLTLAPSLTTGTLNIGAYDLSVPTTGGTVSASSVAFGGGTGVINFNQTDTVTFGAKISGSGRVVQRGSGVTLLTGDNTYTGETIVNGGTLRVGHNNALGTGAVQVNTGGLLDLNGRSISVGGVTGGGAITNSASTAGTLTITQTGVDILPQLTSTGGFLHLVKKGSGTLVLARGNSQTGTVTVVQGILQVGNDSTGGNLGSASLVKIEAGAKLAFARSNAYTYSTEIEGAGSLVKKSAGALTLKGNNSYTGGTYIESGTLVVGHANALGAGPVEVSLDAFLDLKGLSVTLPGASGAGGITNSGSTASTLTINETGASILARLVSSGSNANLNLVKKGAGTLIVDKTNSQKGTVTVEAGTLQVGNGNTGGTLGSASLVKIEADAKLAFARSNAYTYSTEIEGAGSLVKKSGNVLTLQGNNSYTGGTYIESGTLVVGHANALGAGPVEVSLDAFLDLKGLSVTLPGASGAGSITNSGSTASTLTINESDASILARLVSSGSNANLNLVKKGAGTLIVDKTNSQKGTVTVESGTLQIGNGGGGGTLGTNGTVTVHNGAKLVFWRSSNTTVSNVITGAGSLVKKSGNVLTLTGKSTYTGKTSIEQGTLKLSNTGTLYQSGLIEVSSGATFDVSAYTSGYTVKAGQELAGLGTIKGNLNVEGTLSPGTAASPIGTLYVDGNVTLKAGSELVLTIFTNFYPPTKISFAGSQPGTLTFEEGADLIVVGVLTSNLAGNYHVVLNGTVEGVTSFEDASYNYNFSHDGWLTITARGGAAGLGISAVPEPGTYALGGGLLVLGLLAIRRRKPARQS